MRHFGTAATLILLAACTVTPPPRRPMFVAEGLHHTMAITTSHVDASAADVRYEALMTGSVPRLRQARGNRDVYVLRRSAATDVELTIVSVWDSHEELARCRSDAACGAQLFAEATTQEFDVLFEATS
jgi:hypothetical protein